MYKQTPHTVAPLQVYQIKFLRSFLIFTKFTQLILLQLISLIPAHNVKSTNYTVPHHVLLPSLPSLPVQYFQILSSCRVHKQTPPCLTMKIQVSRWCGWDVTTHHVPAEQRPQVLKLFTTGVNKFSENLGATPEFQPAEGWHDASTTKNTICHLDDFQPRDLCTPALKQSAKPDFYLISIFLNNTG
jgi:hypothetical protein